ncbi:hypothetical protein GALMADRAFT_248793 [Galerina marginata CBS 339.88]|uniref:Novel STAND NTPase 1 domain-containing protein n=1 Tax=Galerina marginata (strain CBS 339.88) TaxID=685588 RepID=A0A067T7N6_GALM3|nr:hypothetical protein GALMADRAFT_248793 [Galerina marginata CBS 339.88]
MSAGCFSWFPLRNRWSSKKRTVETKSDEELPEDQLAVVLKTTEYTAVENKITNRNIDVKPSVNPPSVVPTRTQYVTASVKEVLSLLQSAAGVIPVPLLQESIEVALKIIEVCEEASAVESKVKELQDRVGHLMVIVLAHVTAENEEGSKEVVVKAAKGIEEDIKELLRTLETINGDLGKISQQNGWVIAIYKDLNMNTIEDCLNRLSSALEKFKLANDLRDSDLLQELRARLGKMANTVDDISRDLKQVDTKVDGISGDVKQAVAKIEEFEELLKRSTAAPRSDTVARQQIPLKPEIFHGRDGLVEEVVQALMKEETSRVCILGPGGMGKTSVSLAVVESSLVQARFPHGNYVWVPCIGATSAALFLEALYIQLQVPGDKQITLEKIIAELNTSTDPRLLILDNFETPWNAPGGSQKQVEDILRTLAKLDHIAMLVTMRGNNPPCYNAIKWQSKIIEPTDEESCLRIFHDINPSSKDDPDIGHLVSVLGHMPFAVTLMARLAEDAHSTAKDLLAAWSDSGPTLLSDNPEQSMNRSIKLSVDSDLVQRNDNAVLLLAILSLLPAGTTKENLHWWAPSLTIATILSATATLFKAGLLVENKRKDTHSPVLFVVPVVQSFMQHNRIKDDLRKQTHLSCCQLVLNHACRFDDSAFSNNSKVLAAEDTNIQSILFNSSTILHPLLSDKTIEALIAFCWYRSDTKPDPEMTKYAVTATETYGVDNYVASALWCLGSTYCNVGKYDLSYDLLQKAYQLFNSLPNADAKLRRLGGLCGMDLVNAAGFFLDDKDEVVLLALMVDEKCTDLSDDIRGQSLVSVGCAFLRASRHQEALSYLERGSTLLQAAKNVPNLAGACQAISQLHFEECRFSEALEAIGEAWKLAEIFDVPALQSVIAGQFCLTLFSVDRDAEAWSYLEIYLTKARHVGNPDVIADALEYMGYGYLRQGAYQNAYSAYEAAARQYLTSNVPWAEVICKDNMARIKQKQADPDSVVGFNRPSDSNSESLFYPFGQSPVSDVVIISSS